MITTEELGLRLRFARERAGIKQHEAASVLRLDATVIAKMEHGKRGIDAIELLRLARLYKVSIDELLGDSFNPLAQKERTCEHWEMAFCVAGEAVYVRCMNCKLLATVQLDGASKFTTSWARNALDEMRC